jgi:hypothetical protein
MMNDQYKCAMCDGVFIKGWSDEEAAAELKATFNVSPNECDLVCNDCYERIKGGFDAH